MSPLARVAVVCVLLAGAGLFLLALVNPTPADGQGAKPEETARAPVVVSGPAARPGVLDSPETCRECHPEIYAEWMEDRHSQAWVGELYTELSKEHTDASCWSCHAPRPILQTGLSSPAEARVNYREMGITCLTCHANADRTRVLGPIQDPGPTAEVGADCGPTYDPSYPAAGLQQATIDFCGVCHNLHGTHLEFLGSRYAREGMTCLSCHMKEVVGPVAAGGRPRVRRSHRMPGGHVPEMLRRAMRVEARREGDLVVARVVNEGAGHRIPTDARHRGIYLRIAFFDAYDQPVPVPTEQGAPQREVTMDLIRLFYRHEQIDPTQIDPDGTLGKDNWRESSIAIPDRARRGGYAVLRLHYLLRWDWPMHMGTIVQELRVGLD